MRGGSLLNYMYGVKDILMCQAPVCGENHAACFPQQYTTAKCFDMVYGHHNGSNCFQVTTKHLGQFCTTVTS